MSISLGFGARTAAPPDTDDTKSTRQPRTADGGEFDSGGGALRPISLRFLDDALERRYQAVSGAESLTRFRITTASAAVLWLLAAVVVPNGTAIPVDRAVIVCFAVGFLNWAAFLVADEDDTLDRQHAVLSLLTSVNGLVILWLASTGGVLPGYGISAIMLLFAFGFVSRTAFAFAALRSTVIVIGFIVAAMLYRGKGSLEVDALIFGAAVAGPL